MVPGDGRFVPYESNKQPQSSARTNGRIFVLKFGSSSQRHLFWLQSKPQGRTGNPTWLSPRDRKIGEIVDLLLQGDEVDVATELASIDNTDNDDDDAMEDVQGGSGGAGAGATGGDVRREGEGSREGGADGARA